MDEVLQPFVGDMFDDRGDAEETDVQTTFLILCGARWVCHRDSAAASELIAALDSGSADTVLLAGTLLAQGCACA